MKVNKKVVRIVTEEIEKDIGVLTDVDVQFVSLVKHGANRMPFRVVKTEKRGDSVITVQSILVPKGMVFENIVTEKDLEWLAEAKIDCKVDNDEYSNFIQADAKKFTPESLNMIKLNNKGVWAIVGKMEKEEDAKDILTLGKVNTEKAIEVPISVADAPITTIPRSPIVITFKDMFERELYNFLDVVKGTLGQAGVESGKRKKTIISAFDAFKSFIAMALDTVDEKKSAKKEKQELVDRMEQMTDALRTKTDGGTDMFKDKEEFQKAVTGIVTRILDVRDEKAKADAEARVKDQENAEAKENAKKLEDTVAELKTQVNEANETIKKMKEESDNELTTKRTVKKDGTWNVVPSNVDDIFKGLLV